MNLFTVAPANAAIWPLSLWIPLEKLLFDALARREAKPFRSIRITVECVHVSDDRVVRQINNVHDHELILLTKNGFMCAVLFCG